MEYIEFPKALYLKGVYIAVANAAEEEKARADGYTDWAEDYAAHGIPAEPAAPGGEVPAEPASAPAPKTSKKSA